MTGVGELDFIIYVFLLVISVVISYYFTRWIFSVDENLENQKKIIELLKAIKEIPANR